MLKSLFLNYFQTIPFQKIENVNILKKNKFLNFFLVSFSELDYENVEY